MASIEEETGGQPPNLTLDTSRAVTSGLQKSRSEPDRDGSSSDETVTDDSIHIDELQSAISVSISREQKRLMSPMTPAIEKAAAIEKTGFFGGFDGADDELVMEADEDDLDNEDSNQSQPVLTEEPIRTQDLAVKTTETSTLQSSPPAADTQLPSPWRVDNKAQWQTEEKRKSGIWDSLLNRKRASTGTESTIETWQRSFLSSFPAIPKHLSISSSSVDVRSVSQEQTSKETLHKQRESRNSRDDGVGNIAQPTDIDPLVRKRSLSTDAINKPPPLLRRTTSDQSLLTQRTLTRVISLGDDSRFEDVHDQVNSRMKAIKDSWADANIKLPGISAIRVSSLTSDTIRERVSSLNKRQSLGSTPSLGSDPSLPSSSKPHPPVDPITRHPYEDARTAMSDAAAERVSPHPQLNRALMQLEGDIVVLGGYRGSVLRSAEPPHRQVWVPIKVGLNLRKVNLEVGFDEDADERATERIFPDGMLTHIGPVDISRRLLKRLRGCDNVRNKKLVVHDYGYDWRLSPHHLSKQLIQYLEKLACNVPDANGKRRGAIVLAHSLGGLITRHAVNQRPDLFSGVVYAGVPQTCVNILGPLRNGDEVLISDRVLTAQVNFSIRTSFALLPLDGRCFIDKDTKEEYPVDFFDHKTWDEFHLSPCINRPLPPLVPPPKPTGIVSTVASILPSVALPHRNRKDSSDRMMDTMKATTAGGTAAPNASTTTTGSAPSSKEPDRDDSVRTAVTIPRAEAVAYLTRTLASVKRFKQDLAFRPEHADANHYPPIAVIYGKSTPTVYGARVSGREGIKHADAYDDLAFASGDGVVLARAAMVPEGYKPARGGIVASDRGHVTLLGDLEAVGKCLNAVIRARKKGVGMGC